MNMRKDEIIAEIKRHFGFTFLSDYSDFYVGITNDVERRLFTEHNVSEKDDSWIWCQAMNKDTAQKVEEYFLSLGMKGDTGGGTAESVIVYCYKITDTSVESTD